MKLKVLGSSSSGNGYLLYNDSECLIIEAGISCKKAMVEIDYNLNIVQGCLVSHSHGDHAKFIKQYAQRGIKVYSGAETFKDKHHNQKVIKHKDKFKVGGFSVIALRLTHDVPCLGFIINHKETGKIFFATDTNFIPYVIPGVNHMMIECNYDEDVINTNESTPELVDRVIESHLSLKNCIMFLKEQDLRSVHNVLLLHASDLNSNTDHFKLSVNEIYPGNVNIAYRGLELQINKEIF